MKEINKYSIMKARKSDIKQIYMFEREYIIEHEPEQLDKWDAVSNKTTELLNSNIERIFVATVNEELVGHGYWSIIVEEPCIFSIYVLKDCRSKGIASDLMNHIEKHIIESGYNKVCLSTLETNSAQYLFDKMEYHLLGKKNGWFEYSKQLNT